MKFQKTRIATALAGLWLAPALPAFAQEAQQAQVAAAETTASSGIEEIIVTSTRRSTSVQDTPINITAVGGEAAEELGLQDLDQLAKLVPGLNMVDSGPWGNSTIIIRGLNASSITGTGNNTDGGGTVGIYLGETPLYTDFKLLDISRVEALMGPQGTLYGAGTLAGAVRYIPNRPDLNKESTELHGRMYGVAHGDGLGHQEDVTINKPLIDGVLALRGTFGYFNDPGFIDYPNILRFPGTSNPQPDYNDPNDVAGNLDGKSDLNDEKTFTSRVSLLWAPNDKIEGLLTYAHQGTDTNGRQIQSADSIGTGKYEAGLRYAEPSKRVADLVGLELTADFGPASLVSSTSYSKQKINTIRDQTDLLLDLSEYGSYGYEDFPQFSAYTVGNTDRDQYTQELRLVSNNEGPLNWIVGGFYNQLESDSTGIEYVPGLMDYIGFNRPDQMEYYSSTQGSTKEKALFGEIGYHFTDAWQVTLGGRFYDYSVDQTNGTYLPIGTIKQADGTRIPKPAYGVFPKVKSGTGGDDGTLFKINSSYEFSRDLLVYGTVSEGYRLGGINTVAPCPTPVVPGQNVCALPDEQQYLPDRTLNKEIGIHSQWLDRRLTLNASVYHIDWDDVQVGGVTTYGAVGITKNGAKAISQGAELSFQAELPYNLALSGNYTYNDAKLTQDVDGLVDDRYTLHHEPECADDTPGNCSGDAKDGDRLPGSPKHKGSMFLSYTKAVAKGYVFKANYGVSAQSNVFTKVGNRASGEALAGYATHQMSFGIGRDNWEVALFGENIFDKYAETAVTQDSSYVYTVYGGTSPTDADPAAGATTAFDVRRYNKTVIRPAVFGLDFRMSFGD